MVIPESYLMHHGIKGQKWGVRRYQNPDGTLTAAGRKRYGSEEVYNKAVAYKNADKAFSKSYRQYYNKSMQAYSLNEKKRKANTERLNKAFNDYDTLMEAKKNYKNAKTEYRKEAVKKYYDASDKYEEMADKNYDLRRKADKAYKNLGRTKLQRAINAMMNDTDTAKRFNKIQDKWEANEEILSKQSKDVDKLYKDTGRNCVDRIFNNIKYSPYKNKK